MDRNGFRRSQRCKAPRPIRSRLPTACARKRLHLGRLRQSSSMRRIRVFAFYLTAGLAGCNAGSVVAPPIATSGPVTFNYTPGNVCCPSPFSISVQPSGLATKDVNGVAVASVQLAPNLRMQIFSDIQRAWPLDRLPSSPSVPDGGALSVTWDGQTSPDIGSASSGIGAALDADARSLALAFGS
jgi:hypothetical protein